MRKGMVGAIAMALLALAPAAHAATEYGGGSKLRTPWEGHDTNVSLRVIGDGTVRYSIAGLMQCPGANGSYDFFARGRGKEAETITISGSKRLNRYSGRVTARWTLTLNIAGDSATGTVRLTGTRLRRGRTQSCTVNADREVVLRKRAPVVGDPAGPAPLATFYGLLNAEREGTRPSIVIGVKSTGRAVLARWELSAECDDGSTEPLFDTVPLTNIRDNRAVRRELFRVTYSDGSYARVRATTDMRFVAGGVTGTIRARWEFRTKRGRHVTDCDSGVVAFNALAG